METAAKAMTSGTQEILGAGALLEGPQPPATATEPSPANSSEITFTQGQVLNLDISDTIMQKPEGTSTPLPPNPKSTQVESTSAQAGVPVQVPDYLHRFF